MSNLVDLYPTYLRYDDIHIGTKLRVKSISDDYSIKHPEIKVGDIVEVTIKCGCGGDCVNCTTNGKILYFNLVNASSVLICHTTCYYELVDLAGREINYE